MTSKQQAIHAWVAANPGLPMLRVVQAVAGWTAKGYYSNACGYRAVHRMLNRGFLVGHDGPRNSILLEVG